MIPSRFFRPGLTAGLVVVALCLANAGWADAQSSTIYPQIQRSTGFVAVNKGNGVLGYGTCWVADLENNLVVTNVHVIGPFNDIFVAFGRYDINGNLVTSSAAYPLENFINGKVIYRDLKRDLSVVRLNALPRWVRALPLAPKSIQAGQQIWSIGNAGMAGMPLHAGSLWRQRTGTVKKSFFWRTKLLNAEQILEARVIQTDSGVLPGDSGGPIVDAKGRLVGMVSCNNVDGDYGIDVNEVRFALDRALGKTPSTKNALVGAWTVNWVQKGVEYYASMTLNADGSALWEATKQFPGSYLNKDNKLVLELPNSGLSSTVTPAWVSQDLFQFAIQYTEGPMTFTAVRR